MSAAEGFPCPCGGVFEHVVDTRRTKVGIRRRRQCDCGLRVTTYEQADGLSMRLVQREGLEADLEREIDLKMR